MRWRAGLLVVLALPGCGLWNSVGGPRSPFALFVGAPAADAGQVRVDGGSAVGEGEGEGEGEPDAGPASTDAGAAPATWTCDPTIYGNHDACDCGCGAVDPDCPSPPTAADCGQVHCFSPTLQLDPADPTVCIVEVEDAGVVDAGPYDPGPLETCGDLTDDRDGKVYPTIVLADRCWTRTNMDVGVQIALAAEPLDDDVIQKWCLNDDPAECAARGGFYSGDEAVGWNLNAALPRGICPTGWRLPTDADLCALELLVDASAHCDHTVALEYGTVVADRLSVGGVSRFDWDFVGERVGTHDGTSAPFFLDDGDSALWTSTADEPSNRLYIHNITRGYGEMIHQLAEAYDNGVSVRCVRDP